MKKARKKTPVKKPAGRNKNSLTGTPKGFVKRIGCAGVQQPGRSLQRLQLLKDRSPFTAVLSGGIASPGRQPVAPGGPFPALRPGGGKKIGSWRHFAK